MSSIGDYNAIMSDHNVFNTTIYTPLSEALRVLEERQNDPVLMAKVSELLKGSIPDVLLKNKCAVLSRHLATPNHEHRMFIKIAKDNNLYPVFFEYHEDKFTSNNDFKHSLGQLRIAEDVDVNGDYNAEKMTVIDFNLYNGKKISEIKTLWGESLVDFHSRLFNVYDYNNIDDFFSYDASDWFKKNGDKAVNYYSNLFLLFICNGILFENYLTSDDGDGYFTKNIVLPAFDNVYSTFGIKPLIVPLGPLDIEHDPLWYYHLPKVKNNILK